MSLSDQRGDPPALRAGRSVRRWGLWLAAASLIAFVTVFFAAAALGVNHGIHGGVAVILTAVAAISCIAFLVVVAGVILATRRELAGGYTTSRDLRGAPELWVLDDRTGEALREPLIWLIDEPVEGLKTDAGQSYMNRDEFRRIRRSQGRRRWTIAVIAAVVAGALFTAVRVYIG